MDYSVYSVEITPQQLLADGVVGIGYGFVFHKPIGALTAKFGAAETAAPSLVQRLGPKGVDPLHHNANVLVRDASGNVVAHQRFVSGNMTLDEQALGFPKNTLASHTAARAVRTMELESGDRKSVVEGTSVSVRVASGGRRLLKK